MDAYVPESWVTSERLRLEIYTKIAASTTEAQRADIHQELVDRYGSVPVEVERLFTLAQLREKVRSVGIEEIVMQGNNVRFAPVVLPDSRHARLRRLYPKAIAKPAIRTLLVPLPVENERRLGAAKVIEGDAVVQFVEQVVDSVMLASIGS